ncbi:phosphorylcholine transferase LicD [uncultured Methanobrevibacter sp.]|uniref:LicD family protein n=1 Tax=uncultured Methanobrevibacter sp. TaxID=253161 RepID=UPI0025E3DCFF|nr:LicD family protein [uncultured Methanobrevibacter sp.]
MDLSNIYHKLPKKIKNSERMTLYLMKLYKFIDKRKKSNQNTNPIINFLFKSTDIKVTGTLRNMQLVYLELLRFIVNVCDKYGLEYWITYGSLLGAVRHDGFIPWDDDLDISMMRKDYNKLMEILPEEIKKNEILKENCCLTLLLNPNEDYFKDVHGIYDYGSDKHFEKFGFSQSLFLQFGWLKPFIKLDVFPFDYIKEESIDYYIKNYLGHKYYFRVLFNGEDFNYKESFKDQYNKLGLTENETNFIVEGIDATFFDDFGIFKKDLIFPLKTINFEGYEFKCPNKPHELLKIWYGETYMDIPSDLWIHNFSEYNEELFDSKEEMDKAFEETIKYLKEINDNFS